MIGFMNFSRSAFIDRMLLDMQLTNSDGSLILLAEMGAGWFASFFYGYLIRILTRRRLLFASLLFYTVMILGYSQSTHLIMTIGLGFCMGFALNILGAITNVLVGGRKGGGNIRDLNLLHSVLGFGAFLGPSYVAWVLFHLDWRYIYIFGAAYPVLLILVLMLLIPKHPMLDQSEQTMVLRTNLSDFWSDIRSLFKDRRFILSFFGLFFYAASEVPFTTWLVGFLEQIRGLDTYYSRFALSGWLIGLSAGRFLASWLYRWMDERWVVLGFLLGVGGMVLSVLSHKMEYILLGVWINGLAFSFIFPTILGLASTRLPYQKDMLISGIISGSFLGGVFFTVGLGFLNDWIGKAYGIGLPVLTALIGSILMTMNWFVNKKNKKPS